MHLIGKGCDIHGGGHGGGFHFTDASGVSNSNMDWASVDYSLNGSEGRVDIMVIDRDYEFLGKKVVGQMVVTLNEAR